MFAYQLFHQMNNSMEKILFILAFITGFSLGLDCYKCVSLSGSNPECEEPFHSNYSSSILESPCMGGRKGRNGVFPATACLKLAGVYEDTGETMVVRGCGLDSGTLTVDSEIVRMSHCGGFYFDGRYVSGCLQSCAIDGCNSATSTFKMDSIQNVIIILLNLIFILMTIGMPTKTETAKK